MTGRTVVVGFGRTGQAVARVRRDRGDDVVVVDDAPTESGRAAAVSMGVDYVERPGSPDLGPLLSGTDRVVPSPGVRPDHPLLAAATAAGVPVVSEIELAARMAGPVELIAITGTNGKTTVTTLVAAILEASGRRAVAAGNIGRPLVDAVAGDHEVVVAEVSSFQLHFTDTFRPTVSCWLNLSPDHLDWHPSMDHYAAAKARVWAHQGPGDTAVYNADDPAVRSAAAAIPAGVARRSFSTQGPADLRVDGDVLVGPDGEPVLPIGELARAFPHDVANALAVAAVASAAGASREACRSVLASAPGLPHRVSLVGQRDGIAWYDDSKATTPASVRAAVAGFASVVLIAGGRNKGLDLRELAATVPPVRAVVAIGESAPEVEAAFAGSVPVTTAASMTAAVAAAAAWAGPGDAVLLSPGCASFDWYPSYAARGDDFAALVQRTIRSEDPC